MLAYLGLQSVPTEMLYFIVIAAVAAATIFGWTTDIALKGLGFGPIGNALLGTIGAVIGPRIWFVGLGRGSIAQADPTVLLACAGVAGSLLLLAAALLKRALARA